MVAASRAAGMQTGTLTTGGLSSSSGSRMIGFSLLRNTVADRTNSEEKATAKESGEVSTQLVQDQARAVGGSRPRTASRVSAEKTEVIVVTGVTMTDVKATAAEEKEMHIAGKKAVEVADAETKKAEEIGVATAGAMETGATKVAA